MQSWMQSLVSLPLERAYRSSSHELARDFLGHILPQSARYHRAAGFFASSVFGVAPAEFRDFFARGGIMQLVCSPLLSRLDIAAMIQGVFRRRDALAQLRLEEYGRALDPSNNTNNAKLLSWLLATGKLEVRIATPKKKSDSSIYHEKIGFFGDSTGSTVGFCGSANETRSAYAANFERVDVFSSNGGETDRRRSSAIEQHFHDLWNNRTPGVDVWTLHVALQRRLLSIAHSEDQHDLRDGAEVELPPELGSRIAPEALFPSTAKLFDHQTAAIQAWAREGSGRGILEMATGSGKTITALTLASRLYDLLDQPFVLLVIAPLIHLVDQWRDVAFGFGLRPIRCAGSRAEWQEELSTGISACNSGQRPILSAVCTMATLATTAFQTLLADIRCPLLVIADEAHNFGAPGASASLPANATYRVGLSATPERAYDDLGTARLAQYLGRVVYRYTLANALRDGVLTPYRYFPEIVELTSDEVSEYIALTQQIGKYGSHDDAAPSDAVKMLLIRRARLIAVAEAKLKRLRTLVDADRRQTHSLVYCGDGTVEGPQAPMLTRQIDEAVRIIGVDLQLRCASYTAETAPLRRKELAADFASGEVQVLVAIRCLDEGVDIPATRRAYMLASGTNRRQFVQRRGRVLRRSDGKDRAEIYDFFVTFPPSEFRKGAPGFEAGRSLLRGQLERAREFADLAENGPVARRRLLDLQQHFDLLAEG